MLDRILARGRLARYSGVVSLLLCLGFLVVGLWPFDFFPRNKVSWTEETRGLRFKGPEPGSGRDAGGMAFTPVPLVSGNPNAARAFSIEILLRSDREPKGHLPNIAVFCDTSKKATLMVGQWKTSLIVRKYGENTLMGRKWQELGVRNALPEGRTRLVTITFDDTGSIIYLDGKQAKKSVRFSPVRDGMTAEGHYLVLGNSPTAGAGWSGDFLGLALYDRALNEAEVMQGYESWSQGRGASKRGENSLLVHYRFGGGVGTRVSDASGKGNHLLIPRYPVFKRTILETVQFDLRNKGSLIQDMVINIVGFVPFGFFVCVWLRKNTAWSRGRSVWAGIAAGFIVSLAIELTQGFIPVRSSSQLDLICNTLGAGLGGCLVLGSREAGRQES